MAFFRFPVGLLALLLVSSTWAEEGEQTENSLEEDLSVSTLLEKANRNVVHDPDEPTIVDDIAIPPEKNADPCISRGCKWPKYSDGKVYVPYVIANHYTSRELSIIERGLQSFSSSTCIRFTRRTNQRDYLYIQSHNGCYSYVGRVGGSQVVSLSRQGCIYYGTVQHELLHALGFNHEQTRNDRDNHVRILLHNVISGMEHNFNKIDTNNMGTPYDYNSVMQYHRYAFSKNNEPTMVPIPNNNVAIGTATQMSHNDIQRINRLYQCCEYCFCQKFHKERNKLCEVKTEESPQRKTNKKLSLSFTV